MVPAPLLLVAGMSLVQIGNALAIGVFDRVGPFGAGWLRLAAAAVVLAAIVRPNLRGLTPAQLRAAASLGIATGTVTLCFAGAIDRLPLGTAAAIEFLGPLGVAVFTRATGRAGLILPVVAAAGVLCLTQPWEGAVDGLGVVYALLAAGGWAALILLTQRAGAALPGFTGLSVSFIVAATVTAPVGLLDAGDGLGLEPVARMAGIAVLVPLIPFLFEYVALRKMTTAVFGILMCLEPAIGLLVGSVGLGQAPGLLGVAGIVLVVSAGIAANVAGRPPARGPDAEGAQRGAGAPSAISCLASSMSSERPTVKAATVLPPDS